MSHTTSLFSQAALDWAMIFYWPTMIGFFLGFGFGVGCALAVMYSIFMGGYRAAIRDSRLPVLPERYVKGSARLS